MSHPPTTLRSLKTLCVVFWLKRPRHPASEESKHGTRRHTRRVGLHDLSMLPPAPPLNTCHHLHFKFLIEQTY